MQTTFLFQGESTAPLFFAAAMLELARKGHEGQKRKDGKPYITHPIEVERIASVMADNQRMSRMEKEVISSIAYGHDLLEDTDVSVKDIEHVLRTAGAGQLQTLAVVEGIQMLSRPSKEDIGILEYLEPIRRHSFPKIVKLADLQHNLSDLKPGNLYDKYVLCRHYLTSK